MNTTQLLEEANQLLIESKWQEAIEKYQAAVMIEPENAKLHFLLGCCHFRLNEGPAAREAWKKALMLDPHNQEIRDWLKKTTGLFSREHSL